MTRVVTLNAVDGGISRLRNKGGAKPTELYDLLNGYVTPDGGAKSRPGTEEIVHLPADTKGMCAFNGGLVVFCHEPREVDAASPGVTCEVVPHPDDPTVELGRIHYAGPFLGHLYIVAEFADGTVKHFWLQSWGAWAANTVYVLGAVVEPTERNGYGYKATRRYSPGPVWAPNVPRAVGDEVEPTVPNGYKYVVVDVIGDNPTSGATEPAWPAIEGATVIEEVDGASVTTPGDPSGVTTDPTLPPDIEERYRNLAGRGREP